MKQTLDCIMDIGEGMLVSGAEVNRVEDSVKRMCTAFGAVRTDVFIITSSMVVTIHTADGAIVTQTRRINSIGTNIDRLHRLNALSRDICAKRPTLDALRARITEILSDKPYPFIVELFACAAVVSAFTLFFGGGIVEAIVSFIVGIMVKMLSRLTDIMLMNKMFAKFICTFFASSVAYGAVKLSIIPSIDMVLIGNIMSLIPGIGFTNALRDLFIGDSIAGALRLFEAILGAVSIAAGYFLFVCTLGRF